MNDLSKRFLEVLDEMCKRDIGRPVLPRNDYYVKTVTLDDITDEMYPIGPPQLGLAMPNLEVTITLIPIIEIDHLCPERPDYTHESTAEEIRELPESRLQLNRGGSES